MKISKSKQELARIISENGGWRDGAESAAQSKSDNDVSFYRDTAYREGDRWWGSHIVDGDIWQGKLIPNWHKTILSRAEYFHLYPAPDADGWIEFDGTERPSGYFNKMIDVKLQDGRELTDSSGRFEWDTDGPSRIIAYRLHKPEQAKPTAVGDDETNLAAKEELEAMEYKPSIDQLMQTYSDRAHGLQLANEHLATCARQANEAMEALSIACKAAGFDISPITAKQEPELVTTKFTGRFHSAKNGDRPEDLDMICDGCGKRFGTHVGCDCRP